MKNDSLTICGCCCGKPKVATDSRQPEASIFDSRTLQSTPENGSHAGYGGAKRRKGSKVHAAVDMLSNSLILLVTPANEQDPTQVGELAQAVQDVTGQTVELAFVDQDYTGDVPEEAAQQHSIQLEVVKRTFAKHGFVLVPRRGSSNARLPGLPAFDAWCAIMSGFLLPLLACIWSCLLVLCAHQWMVFSSP